MARTKRSSYKRRLRLVTNGLFNTLTDFCLFFFCFSAQSFRMSTGRTNLIEAILNSVHGVKMLNPSNLKRTIYSLKQRDYLQKKKDYYKITKLGKERLKRTIPSYEEKRPWDGILYLVVYDIPEQKRTKRNILRKYLKMIGCGMLQHSVWLTPYNPKRIIADFAVERKLIGLILVSELKEGSRIGGKDMLDVLQRVYKLDELNEDYQNLVHAQMDGKIKGWEYIINYFAILKKDPQLPFALLQDDWFGDEAYYLYKKELKKIKKIKNKRNQ